MWGWATASVLAATPAARPTLLPRRRMGLAVAYRGPGPQRDKIVAVRCDLRRHRLVSGGSGYRAERRTPNVSPSTQVIAADV